MFLTWERFISLSLESFHMETFTKIQRRKLDLTPLDELMNMPKINTAIARSGEVSKVVELARGYSTSLGQLSALLMGAIDQAKANSEYLDSVRSGSSRDCFYLALSPDSLQLPINQLQARLEFEGVIKEEYLSVREQLLEAQRVYRDSLSDFKQLVSPA